MIYFIGVKNLNVELPLPKVTTIDDFMEGEEGFADVDKININNSKSREVANFFCKEPINIDQYNYLKNGGRKAIDEFGRVSKTLLNIAPVIENEQNTIKKAALMYGWLQTFGYIYSTYMFSWDNIFQYPYETEENMTSAPAVFWRNKLKSLLPNDKNLLDILETTESPTIDRKIKLLQVKEKYDAEFTKVRKSNDVEEVKNTYSQIFQEIKSVCNDYSARINMNGEDLAKLNYDKILDNMTLASFNELVEESISSEQLEKRRNDNITRALLIASKLGYNDERFYLTKMLQERNYQDDLWEFQGHLGITVLKVKDYFASEILNLIKDIDKSIYSELTEDLTIDRSCEDFAYDYWTTLSRIQDKYDKFPVEFKETFKQFVNEVKNGN